MKRMELAAIATLAIAFLGLGASPPDSDLCSIEKSVIHHMEPAGVTRTTPQFIREIAIEDRYAVALWVLGEAGGTATLQKKGDKWVVLYAGGGWNSAGGLIDEGVPKAIAHRLARDVGMSG